MYNRPQKLAAELLGTCAVVLISAGAVCANQFLRTTGHTPLGPAGIALAYGLAYGAFVATTVRVSGGHLNPAITVGRWVIHEFGLFDTLTYILAQLAGSALAAYALRSAVPERIWLPAALGTPDLANGVTRGPAMLIEAALALVVVFGIFAVAAWSNSSRSLTGLAAGILVAAAALLGQPFTGAAMNPARVFGPALAARHWINHGVYWVGPLAGGAAAAIIYSLIFLRRRTSRTAASAPVRSN